MEQDLCATESSDSKVKAENQISSLLQGFQPKGNQSEVETFLREMTEAWSEQLNTHQVEQETATLDNCLDIIQSAMNAIMNNKKDVPTPKTVDTISIGEFIAEYCVSRVTPAYYFYLDVESSLLDDCGYAVTERDLVLHKKKGVKKFENAAKTYAYDPRHDNHDFTGMHDVLTLIDTTVWGSGKTGFCFTHNYVVFKDIGYCHELYYYNNIEKLGVEDEEFYISGKSTQGSTLDYLKYNSHKATPALKTMCQCVTDYISQPSYQILSFLKKKVGEKN